MSISQDRANQIKAVLAEIIAMNDAQDLGGWGNLRLFTTDAEYLYECMELREVVEALSDRGVTPTVMRTLLTNSGTETVQFSGAPRPEKSKPDAEDHHESATDRSN